MPAAPLLRLVIRIYGTAAAICLIAGLSAILWDSIDPAGFRLLGRQVTIAHIGAAFVGVGLLTALFVICFSLRTQRQLAPLAHSSRRRRSRH